MSESTSISGAVASWTEHCGGQYILLAVGRGKVRWGILVKELLVTLAILHGGDAASTQVGLHKGLWEANPFLPQNPTANLVVKAAYATISLVLLEKLSHKAPRLAKGIAIGAIVAESAVIGRNVQLIIRVGKQ